MTPKQAQVLKYMRQGKTFDIAYLNAGCSQFGSNELRFLERLIADGYVRIELTDKGLGTSA